MYINGKRTTNNFGLNTDKMEFTLFKFNSDHDVSDPMSHAHVLIGSAFPNHLLDHSLSILRTYFCSIQSTCRCGRPKKEGKYY